MIWRFNEVRGEVLHGVLYGVRHGVFRGVRLAPRCAIRLIAWALLALACASPAFAQNGGRDGRDPGLVEVDPLRCWWRTSKGAVSVGEPFTIVLTCAALENASVRVVVDESPLAIGSIQLAPFELIGGSHPADLRSGQRRFFQYDYTVRIIDPGAFNRDVRLPQLTIHYRVESKVQADSVEGRDRLYLLPIAQVKVLSTVPAEALDIRDGAEAPFAAVEATRFRARVFDLVATGLFVLALVIAVPALARVVRGTTVRQKEERIHASERAVLSAAVAELADLQRQGRSGWTTDLQARALAATRIVAGAAIGQRVSQRPATSGTDAGDARLLVNGGLVRKQRVTVASATTAEDVAKELQRRSPGDPWRPRLEGLRDALEGLTSAVYSSSPESAAASADDHVSAALRAGKEVRRQRGGTGTFFKRFGARR